MGEILVACFIGVWLTLAGYAAYKQLQKEYRDEEGKK